jgi:capsule polysaccharide export protein KpsE/RkpR
MNGAGTRQSPVTGEPEILEPSRNGQQISDEQELTLAIERQAQVLRLLWDRRSTLLRVAGIALLASTLIAVLIPNSYTSTAQLMPPDTQSSTGMAMLAALAGKAGVGAGSGLAGVAGDLLGVKTSGALFIGVLRSETSQDRIIQEFNLQKVYRKRHLMDARKKLDDNTTISEDRKSGLITIAVMDHDAKRAADIANAYINELNILVAQLSTSAAHRERVFLEDRLKVAKTELDSASNALAQFSSKNNTLDIQSEGRAMLDAAASLAGGLIAAQSELEGLRQIYTDNNPKVKAVAARVAELRQELEKLGGINDIPRPNGSSSTPSVGVAPQPGTTDTVASGKVGSLPFPTIRNLPLLGAKWSDYYRQAKIQETVYELLTGQYELARVEEAKETPSVKVLDPGKVPEKKSFPPRLLIISLGTFLAIAGCVVVLLGQRNWEQTDNNDPRKVLAQEVFATLKANAPWAETNGTPPSRAQRIWTRFNGGRPPANGADAAE